MLLFFLYVILEDFDLRGKLNSFETPRVYKEHLSQMLRYIGTMIWKLFSELPIPSLE